MSKKGMGDPAQRDGRYYTVDALATAIVARLDLTAVRTVWEPHAGGGAFVRALAARRAAEGLDLRILATDLNPRCHARSWLDADRGDLFAEHDFLVLDPPRGFPSRVDAVIGNPPYSIRVPRIDPKTGNPRVYDAEVRSRRTGKVLHRPGDVRLFDTEVATDHVLRALEVLEPHGFATMLLRVGFLGGIERHARLYVRDPLWRVDPVIPRPSFTGGGTDSSEYAAIQFRPEPNPGDFAGRPILWRL